MYRNGNYFIKDKPISWMFYSGYNNIARIPFPNRHQLDFLVLNDLKDFYNVQF